LKITSQSITKTTVIRVRALAAPLNITFDVESFDTQLNKILDKYEEFKGNL
jgi:hypothetical protein